MFRITGMKSGVVWDAEANKALIHFHDGVAETEDQAIAERLQSMGYDVEGEFKELDALDAMKVDELIAYAQEKGIDLGGASKKAEILAAIQAAE